MDRGGSGGDTACRLGRILLDRDRLIDEQKTQCSLVEQVVASKDVLLDVLAIHENVGSRLGEPLDDDYRLTRMQQPYVVVGRVSLLVVFNFGAVLRENPSFCRESIVRPVNYKAKRLYYGEGRQGAAFYTCKLTSKRSMPCYSITTESGRTFCGARSVFQEFAKALRADEFRNIDDFFGLTDSSIQKTICEMAGLCWGAGA